MTETVCRECFKCKKSFWISVKENNAYEKYICVNCQTSFIEKLIKLETEGHIIKRARKPTDFDIRNKATWRAKCCECGSRMDYIDSEHDPRYLCRKCGNILEV